MKRTAFAFGAILSSAVFMACGSDKGPTDTGISITGNYTATQWLTTGGSGQTNQLLAGSTLAITLNANGTTSGHMHLVASGNNPAVEADMAGTWSLSGTTVDFSQSADTFVRDMQFSVVANGVKWALEGDHVFSGTEIKITLTPS